MRVFMVNPPPINIGGRQSRSLYQFTLQDTDTDELYRVGAGLEAKMRDAAGPRGRQQRPAAQEPAGRGRARPRPDRGARPDRQPGRDGALNAYGTRQVSQIYAPNNQYQVILQVAPEFQQDPAALSMLYVRGARRRSWFRCRRWSRTRPGRPGRCRSATPGSCRR